MRRSVVGALALAVGAVAALCALVLVTQRQGGDGATAATPTVYDRPATGGGPLTVTVREAPTGPIADLPSGWSSFAVHELDGRSWLVVTSPEGGVAMVPQLDADGTQHVVPQS